MKHVRTVFMGTPMIAKTLLENIKGLLKIGLDEQTIKKGLNCTDEQIKEAKAN